MSTLNTRQKLFGLLNAIAGSAAQGSAYAEWGDDFARKEIREILADELAAHRKPIGWKFTAEEILSANDDDLCNLGFRRLVR